MMYPYMVLADGTEITHSHIIDDDGTEQVEVHFERATEQGFDSARCVLPTYHWKFNEGFSPEEIHFFEEFLCLACSVSVGIWCFCPTKTMSRSTSTL